MHYILLVFIFIAFLTRCSQGFNITASANATIGSPITVYWTRTNGEDPEHFWIDIDTPRLTNQTGTFPREYNTKDTSGSFTVISNQSITFRFIAEAFLSGQPLLLAHSSSVIVQDFSIPNPSTAITVSSPSSAMNVPSSTAGSTTASTSDSAGKKRSQLPIIIGSVIGGLLVVTLPLLLLFLRHRRNRRIFAVARAPVELNPAQKMPDIEKRADSPTENQVYTERNDTELSECLARSSTVDAEEGTYPDDRISRQLSSLLARVSGISRSSSRPHLHGKAQANDVPQQLEARPHQQAEELSDPELGILRRRVEELTAVNRALEARIEADWELVRRPLTEDPPPSYSEGQNRNLVSGNVSYTQDSSMLGSHP